MPAQRTSIKILSYQSKSHNLNNKNKHFVHFMFNHKNIFFSTYLPQIICFDNVGKPKASTILQLTWSKPT